MSLRSDPSGTTSTRLDTLRVDAEKEKLMPRLVARIGFELVENLHKAPPGKSTLHGHSAPVLKPSSGLSQNMPLPLKVTACNLFAQLISFSSVRSGGMREGKGRAERAKGVWQKVASTADRGGLMAPSLLPPDLRPKAPAGPGIKLPLQTRFHGDEHTSHARYVEKVPQTGNNSRRNTVRQDQQG